MEPKTQPAQPPSKPPYPNKIDEYYDPIRNLAEQIQNLSLIDAQKLRQYMCTYE